MNIELRIHTLWRTTDTDDEGLGEQLRSLATQAVARGGAPPAAVMVREERLDLLYLKPIAEARIATPAFLAGLTRSELDGASEVRAVGLIGTFELRRGPPDPKTPGVPVVLVFLEWADCRWWQWQALLDGPPNERPSLREDTEVVRRAVDGDAKPSGLGGWWSLGRRGGTGFVLRPKVPALVH